MKTKHTQGDWRVNGHLDDLRIMNKESQICVVRCFDSAIPNYKESEANAKLIAAAPEMLKELEKSNKILIELSEKIGGSIFGLLSQISKNKKLIKKATQ